MRVHAILLSGMAACISLSFYKCVDRFLWLLEAAPVLIGMVLLCWSYSFYKFTSFTYCLIAFSFLLILIGAHYTYSNVPLFNWLKDELSLSRNHYDRLGHFFQGVIPAIMTREIFVREDWLAKRKWLNLIIILSCVGISAVYEIIEMLASFVVHGATIDWFLGLQGDVWDTQEDMSMALLGAVSALLLLGKAHNKYIKTEMIKND